MNPYAGHDDVAARCTRRACELAHLPACGATHPSMEGVRCNRAGGHEGDHEDSDGVRGVTWFATGRHRGIADGGIVASGRFAVMGGDVGLPDLAERFRGAHETELRRLRKQLTEAHEVAAEYRDRADKALHRAKRLERNLDEAGARIEALEAKFKTAGGLIETLTTDRDALEEKLAEALRLNVQSRNVRASEENRDLRVRLEAAEGRVVALEQTCAELRHQRDQAEATAERRGTDLDRLEQDREPRLGCATTRHLIAELAARADVAETIGEAWPSYRTAGDDDEAGPEPTPDEASA